MRTIAGHRPKTMVGRLHAGGRRWTCHALLAIRDQTVPPTINLECRGLVVSSISSSVGMKKELNHVL
jgi:hypothetical protein